MSKEKKEKLTQEQGERRRPDGMQLTTLLPPDRGLTADLQPTEAAGRGEGWSHGVWAAGQGDGYTGIDCFSGVRLLVALLSFSLFKRKKIVLMQGRVLDFI